MKKKDAILKKKNLKMLPNCSQFGNSYQLLEISLCQKGKEEQQRNNRTRPGLLFSPSICFCFLSFSRLG